MDTLVNGPTTASGDSKGSATAPSVDSAPIFAPAILEVEIPEHTEANRILSVSRNDLSQADPDPLLYFHRPLLALVPGDKAMFFGTPTDDGNERTYTFKFQLGHPALTNAIRAAIVKQDTHYIAKVGATDGSVALPVEERIRPVLLPLDSIALDIMKDDRPLDAPLGSADTENYSGKSSATYLAHVHVPYQRVEEFEKRLRDSAIGFRFSYNWPSRKSNYSTTTSSAVAKVTGDIKELVTQASRKLDGQIFLAEKSELLKRISLRISRVTRGNINISSAAEGSPDTSFLEKALFSENTPFLTWDEFKRIPNAEEKLANYLQGQQNTFKRDEQHATSTSTETDNTTKAGLSLKLAGIGFSFGDDEIQKIKDQSGVTLKESSTVNVLEVRGVTLAKINQSVADISIGFDVETYMAGAGEFESAVEVTSPLFTLDAALKSLAPPDAIAFDRILLGTALPWFGEKKPVGYVWADGKSNWPDAEWVPPKLRGQPVPNLDKVLIGGSNDEVALGADGKPKYLSDQGALPIPSADIDFGGLHASVPVRKSSNFVLPEDYVPPTIYPGPPGLFADDTPASRNTWAVSLIDPTPSAAFGGSLRTPSQKLPVSIEQSPPYAKLRWIIRVE